MIENESQRQQAERQIAYWKFQLIGGSWMGLEGARREIRRLQNEIDEYHRRESSTGAETS